MFNCLLKDYIVFESFIWYTSVSNEVHIALRILLSHWQYLTNKTWFWGQYGSLRSGQSKLEWHLARSEPYNVLVWTAYCPKIHVLFVILYRIYGFKKNCYCLTISTNYFIDWKKFNIKVLRSKPFKNDLIDQSYF